ncbi:MAG: cell envelope integrity protein TolA [Alphaproteobacteria bacterium]|nr:cell envelope integrity protein TolA [Alphaproteobacteria bacterium]
MILDDGNLRNSIIISTCLHIAMLLFMYFGLPRLFKPLPPLSRPIPVDIVEIGAITNLNINKNEEENKPAASQATKPEPPQKAEMKPPEPINKPEVKPQEQKADKAEDAALLPKPMTKPAPPEPPKPVPQKAQQDQLASVLKNVAKLKPQGAKSEDMKNDAKTGQTNVVNGGQGGLGPSLSDRLTISDEDALRRQIQQCWNIPAGARDAEKLVVEVLIEMNPDRTVREARVVDDGRLGGDPFYRAAAESALRALRNPKCSPLELPPDQYEQWKTITFTFDPRDML